MINENKPCVTPLIKHAWMKFFYLYALLGIGKIYIPIMHIFCCRRARTQEHHPRSIPAQTGLSQAKQTVIQYQRNILTENLLYK